MYGLNLRFNMNANSKYQLYSLPDLLESLGIIACKMIIQILEA